MVLLACNHSGQVPVPVSDVLEDPARFLSRKISVCGRLVDEFESCRLEGKVPTARRAVDGRILVPVSRGLELSRSAALCSYGDDAANHPEPALVLVEGTVRWGGLDYVLDPLEMRPYAGTCALREVLVRPRAISEESAKQ